MNKTYCGACHGERGCPECNKAAKTCFTIISQIKTQKLIFKKQINIFLILYSTEDFFIILLISKNHKTKKVLREVYYE